MNPHTYAGCGGSIEIIYSENDGRNKNRDSITCCGEVGDIASPSPLHGQPNARRSSTAAMHSQQNISKAFIV